MNYEEAKLILQACRPGDEAAADPQLAEALALAQADPELAAWYAEEQRWDATMRRELETVPVPPDLKTSILAREKVVELPVAGPRASLFAWHSPLVWAMAAAIVIFMGLAFNGLRAHPAGQSADFARDMIVASPHDAHHVDVRQSDVKQAQAWLGEHHALANLDLPLAIQRASGLMGCRVMDWHGRPVSMLCYLLKGSQHVDLFVTPANAITDAPEPGKPHYAIVSDHMTAGWTVDGNYYLMSGQVPRELLQHYLEPSNVRRVSPFLVGAAY